MTSIYSVYYKIAVAEIYKHLYFTASEPSNIDVTNTVLTIVP